MQTNSCSICGTTSNPVSGELGVCIACIRKHPERSLPPVLEAHRRARVEFNLPQKPPRDKAGIVCGLCSRMCSIAEGGRGFCGLRKVVDGKLIHLAGTPARGLLHWYRDPLPTNCVADWLCPGHRRLQSHNLAVFYASCTLDCLFCQNWHFRNASPASEGEGNYSLLSAKDLASKANEQTFCVCFFGGDPASQMPHALAASRLLLQEKVAICWETAGTMHPKFLHRAIDFSLASGGCIKFDIKAFDDNLHRVLTGASNRRTLDNFQYAATRFKERKEPPLLFASTLLVPGYVDALEVERIARFIASLDPTIPYALLGFFPHFFMSDLPPTSSNHASQAMQAARDAGLTNVRLGNVQLLSNAY